MQQVEVILYHRFRKTYGPNLLGVRIQFARRRTSEERHTAVSNLNPARKYGVVQYIDGGHNSIVP